MIMGIHFKEPYHTIVSLDNLLEAWKEFIRGKRFRKDVQEFERDLMKNIISLHKDLVSKKYKHRPYQAFNISDPKPRNIHKASVRDRLLHHALYRSLYPFFDRTFTSHSYSCRRNKGTHKAIDAFRSFAYKTSKNHTKTVWVLKGDIRKFFASIDHSILIKILESYIPDKDIVWVISEIVSSFHSTKEGVGLPLGNLTSQLLVNIYMNKFDQFVKHKLKATHYVRYADDFAILSRDKEWLENLIPRMNEYLWNELKLEMHPNKIAIRTVASGVDFLGWVLFPDHRIVRTVTKNRLFRSMRESEYQDESVQSCLGLLSHSNAKGLIQRVLKYSEKQGRVK